MNQEEKTAGEDIGWHVIARDGDMTARVHGGMCLGQGPSGEISFEPVDGVVGLGLEGSQLKLTALRQEQELLVPGEHPARAVLVSPQTHVSLIFRNQTIQIDNDFALARPAGGALHVEVIDADSSAARVARGPSSAGRRLRGVSSDVSNRTIVVSEVGSSLWTSPEDHLPRPDRQGLPAEAKQPLALGALLIAIVAGLLALAVYLPTRLTGPEPLPEQTSEPSAPPQAEMGPEAQEAAVQEAVALPGQATMTAEPVSESANSTADETPAGATLSTAQTDTVNARVSDALLDRFSVLIEAQRLPDRGTVDFMVETLKSLQAAYPNDARVPEALNRLALRLLDEARATYDAGDAFQAGRLIELAVTTGAARSAVDETLAEMASRPAAGDRGDQSAASQAVPPAKATAEPAAAAATEVTTAAVVGDAGAAAGATEPTDADPEGLDSLVRQATGESLGALAVETAVESDPDEVLTLMLEDAPVDLTMGTSLQTGVGSAQPPAASEPPVPVDPAATADRLPEGFVLEDAVLSSGDPLAPAYRPFNELTVLRRTALEYPPTAPRRRNGTVEVTFTVSESGGVTDLSAETDLEAVFSDAAMETIGRWRFAPVIVDGQPVAVRSAIRVTFRD